MDFELPQEIRMLKDTMRRFVDRELIPIEMHAMDGPDLKPEIRKELEAKTRELGLWLLEVPAELGGQDLSLLGDRGDQRGAGAHRGAAGARARHLRAGGALHPAVALARSRRSAISIRCCAARKPPPSRRPSPMPAPIPAACARPRCGNGDHYVINGYKRFIAHAKDADFLQLVAATDPKKGSRGGLTVFLVDMDTPGVSIAGKTVHMMGDVTYEIALDDVKVPVENRIGNEGDGMKAAQTWINANRVVQAARGLGVAQRCLEMITSYARAAQHLRPAARRAGRRCNSRWPTSTPSCRPGSFSPIAPPASSTPDRCSGTRRS